jgi:hypothetical protein
MREQPTALELLAERDVIVGLRCAYEESGIGTDSPIEQGGFILHDSDLDTFEVVRLPACGPDLLAYPICPYGTYQDKKILASFHTHPNIGPEWRQPPSLQDIRMSQDYPETMGPHQFVISMETIYHIDNDGIVTEIGPARQLLRLNEDRLK